MAALIECDGTRLVSLRLPPFHVSAREFVCLHLPDSSSPDVQHLKKALTGGITVPGLRVMGTITWAEPALPRRNFLGMVRDPHIGTWLTKEDRLSAAQVQALLQQQQIASNTRIGLLSWTARHLLALEAALARPADVIGFDTSGLDPRGIQQVNDRVQAHLVDRAFLHLSFHPLSDGPCFPGSRCITAPVQLKPQREPALRHLE